MNGVRQVLITQNQHIHAGAWPALSTMAGFEAVADAQMEALMKAHALTAQVFVITASNYVDQTCLDWKEKNLGKQDLIRAGSPSADGEEKLVQGDVDFSQLGAVKVWIDTARNYQRPEILQFSFDSRQHWADEKTDRFKIRSDEKPKKDTGQQL